MAEHGSWNRPKKIGYRVVSVILDSNDDVVEHSVFVDGWATDYSNWGRPTDIAVLNDGSILISEDNPGSILRVYYDGPTPQPTNSPTTDPSTDPTLYPTADPTYYPSTDPTVYPTVNPTYYPSNHPTVYPSTDPTLHPTYNPTGYPSSNPTNGPSSSPMTRGPTVNPTANDENTTDFFDIFSSTDILISTTEETSDTGLDNESGIDNKAEWIGALIFAILFLLVSFEIV